MAANVEYVPVWRVQVWKGKHLIEAELYDTEAQATEKAEEFKEQYQDDVECVVKLEKDFLKLAKEHYTPIWPTGFV